MSPSSPIVVLDSGLGGLTVVRALQQVIPGEQIIYFGDTARLPYGSKTATTVCGFVQQIIGYLRPFDPKHVVIACNTASALALSAARAAFPGLPISGVVEPGAKAAVIAARDIPSPRIGVIATEATIRSKAYARTIRRHRPDAIVLDRATPLLVPLIEEGRLESDPVVRLAVAQYLQPLVAQRLDVLVLGCTHYPVYRELMREQAGSSVAVIDSARQCADDVARRIQSSGLARPAGLRSAHGEVGNVRCFVTDDPVRFCKLAPRFVGTEIAEPVWVAPDDLYSMPHTSAVRLSVQRNLGQRVLTGSA